MKKLFLFILILALSISLTSVCVSAESYETDRASNAQELLEIFGGDDFGWINDDGELCLKDDVKLARPVCITGGEIVIKGASCMITADFALPQMFSIEGGKLILGSTSNKDNADTLIISSEKSRAFTVAGGTLEMYSGVTIEKCHSDADGGAICVEDGEFDFFGGIITGCKSDTNGGAIALLGGKLVLSSKEVVSAKEVQSAQIKSCEAVNGGALYVSGGELKIENFTFGSEAKSDDSGSEIMFDEENANIATENGGAIFFEKGEGVDVTQYTLGNNFTLNGNKAHRGGGMYISEGTAVGIGASTVYNNTANEGGGIYVDGSLIMQGTYIAYNSADNGGGVYLSETRYDDKAYNLSMVIKDGCVNSNSALVGGGVYSKGIFMQLGGAINYNEAQYYAGGIFNEGYYSYSMGSLGYNRIKGEHIIAKEMLNTGNVSFSNEVFVGGEGDIVMANGTAIDLSGPFTTTTTIARLLPADFDGVNIVPKYDKGQILLKTDDSGETEDGKKTNMAYYSTLFKVVKDETGGEYSINKKGALASKPMDPWLIAALSCCGAVIVAGVIYAVKMRKKK